MSNKNSRILRFQSGFTLLELTLVVAIIGILAATLTPKLLDLSTSARITAVNDLAGNISSAAAIALSACRTSTTCPMTYYTAAPTVTLKGTVYYFHWGYPTAWGNPSASQKGDIGDWLASFRGFTKATYIPNSYSVSFTRDDAPDPSNCEVTYRFPNAAAQGDVAITTTTTGC